MTGPAIELRKLLDELRKRGRMSRIQEPRDPDYWPHTMAARGLIASMRGNDVGHRAVYIARLLLEAHAAIIRDDRIRADERSRVLASVADDIRGLTRHGDEAYEELANMYSSGRMPGDEEVSR